MDRRSFPTTTDTSKLAGAVDPAAALKDLDSRNNPHSTIRVTTRFSGGELRQHQMNSNSSEPSTCPRPRAQAATFALILDQSRLNSQLIGTALSCDSKGLRGRCATVHNYLNPRRTLVECTRARITKNRYSAIYLSIARGRS